MPTSSVSCLVSWLPGEPGSPTSCWLTSGLAAESPTLVPSVTCSARSKVMLELVFLPSSKLADGVSQSIVPVHRCIAVILRPLLPLIGTGSRPTETTEPPIVGERPPEPARSSVRPSIRPTSVPSEGCLTCKESSLVTSSSGITLTRAVVHTTSLMPKIRHTITSLSRCSKVGLPDIGSCTLTRILIILPLGTELSLMGATTLASIRS